MWTLKQENKLRKKNTTNITTQSKKQNMSDNQSGRPARESLRSQKPEEENQPSLPLDEQLIEREELKGTPFQRITSEGKTFIAFGKYRISDYYKVEDIPEGEPIGEFILDNEQWKITVNLIALLIGINNTGDQ